MIKAAFADPDPRIQVVMFDPWERRFRPLASFEQKRLADDTIASFRLIRWPGRIAMLRRAFELVRQHPWAKRHADRHLAKMITDGDDGLDSTATRLLIRAYRLYRRACDRLGWRRVGPVAGPADVGPDTILISQHTLVGYDTAAVADSTNKIGFVCHDLIPILRPDLVGKGSEHFGDNVKRLVRSGATAFCASDAASAMLTTYMKKADIALSPVQRFPMPSSLHAIATSRGMTSRLESSEPFVLYCSTIEVRKNHLMLARIWRQALEDGVRLPKLICVGRWGWMVEELRAYLKAHPELAASVSFTGPISDEELIGKYRSACFGVFPSHIEGWGYAASECLDFGVPVIVSTAPALIEATGGLMPAIDADDQAGWYAAIGKMAQDRAWRASLVDRIAQQHRPTSVAASWAAIKAGLS